MLDLAARRAHCEDTISRAPSITSTTPGASLIITKITSQISPLTPQHPSFPSLILAPITVHNSESFTLARSLLPSKGTIGVLNLASDRVPGGGWCYTLSFTQEEALCYSSTLYPTLKPEWYPWPNKSPGSCAGVFSPGVVVFKDTLDNELVDLPVEERCVVSVITVTAPCVPQLTTDRNGFASESELEDLRERILPTLRMAATNAITKLVLGAMGCGASMCPYKAVAEEMKRDIKLDEFKQWFEVVTFAVYAAGLAGNTNFEVFKDVFENPL